MAGLKISAGRNNILFNEALRITRCRRLKIKQSSWIHAAVF